MHGDLAQSMREQTLEGFKAGKFAVLAATDVAARGLDINGIELVLMVRPGGWGASGSEGQVIWCLGGTT